MLKSLLQSLVGHQNKLEMLLGILAASLCINLLSLTFPVMLLQIYDRIIPNQAIETLMMLVLIVVSAQLIELVLKVTRAYVTAWAAARYEHNTSVEVFRHIIFSRLKDFKKVGEGAHFDRISALFGAKDFYGGQSLSLLIDVPFVFVYLSFIAYIGGWLVLVPIVVLTVFVATAHIYGNKLRQRLTERKVQDERRMNFIIEMLNGINIVKSLAIEPFMQRRYERLQRNSQQNDNEMSLLSSEMTTLSNFYMQCNTVCLVGIGCLFIISGDMTMGALAACTLLSNRCLNPVGGALSVWRRIQSILIAEKNVDEFCAMEIEDNEQAEVVETIRGKIDLNNIYLKREDSESYLFENLSLSVAPGETIGIVGEGSSGKSTLMRLILGLYQPDKGEVFIDDKNVELYDKDSLRRHIGYMPQNGKLYQGTILENITLFRDGEIIDRAVKTVEDMALQDVIHHLPQGYSTEVGGRVVDFLPAGIRQRIVAAQALIDYTNIVLFDEANTAVDREADENLQAMLRKIKGQCTMILISHRPSLLNIADKCFRLQQGKLVEIKRETGVKDGNTNHRNRA